jgi:hypothetical protein
MIYPLIQTVKDLEPTDPQWAFGRQIDVEDLVLVSLVQVAKSSWQPYFKLCYGRD